MSTCVDLFNLKFIIKVAGLVLAFNLGSLNTVRAEDLRAEKPLPAVAYEAGLPATPKISETKVWSFKAEVETETLQDKNYRQIGYEVKSDVKVYRAFSSRWGVLTGGRHLYESRDIGENLSSWNEASIGTFRVFELTGWKINTELSYNHHPDEKFRLEESRTGTVEFDTRTNMIFTNKDKTRLRWTLSEYRTTKSDSKVDLRQSKFEISPSIKIRRWGMGVQNKITHKFKSLGTTGHIENAPFIKYNGRSFEPMFKVAYRTLGIKDELYSSINDWENHPVYSLELEMGF